MQVIFKLKDSIIQMKDRIDVEGKYITTSTINGEKKTILKKCENEEETNKLLNNIFSVIDRGIQENKKIVSIILEE